MRLLILILVLMGMILIIFRIFMSGFRMSEYTLLGVCAVEKSVRQL